MSTAQDDSDDFQEVAVDRRLLVAALDASKDPVAMVFSTLAAMETRVQQAVEDKAGYERSSPALLKLTYIQPVRRSQGSPS